MSSISLSALPRCYIIRIYFEFISAKCTKCWKRFLRPSLRRRDTWSCTTNLFLLDDQGVPGNDADAIDGGVGVQVDRFWWKAGENLKGGDRHPGKLGELRLQLERFVIGRETVNDLLARLGLHPEHETRHGGPIRISAIRGVLGNQLFHAPPHGTLVLVLVLVVVVFVVFVFVALTAERSIMSVREYTWLYASNHGTACWLVLVTS